MVIFTSLPLYYRGNVLFNGTQSRVVTGLAWTYTEKTSTLMGLSCSPLCRRCGAEEETSIHVLWEREALALLIHAHLGSFFLDPEDIKSLSLGAFWNFSKGAGLP